MPTTDNDGPCGQLLRRFRRAKKLKDNWTSLFQECYDYALPARIGFYSQTPGTQTTDNIFDETAVVGVQEFASRLQDGLVPNYSRWSELKPGSDVMPEERPSMEKDLDDITQYVFEVLQSSNFAQEIHEAFLDLAVGTGALIAEMGDAVNPVRFQAISMPELYIDEGPTGAVDWLFRPRKLRLEDILTLWPEANIPIEIIEKGAKDSESTFNVMLCTYRDITRLNEDVFLHKVILVNEKCIIHEDVFEGVGSNPFLIFRWAKAAGEVWGRGPLIQSLPAIKTCNLTVQLILENAELSVAGLWQADDDGVVNVDTIQLVPGTIIPKAAGSNGLQPLSPGGDFNVANLVLADMRANIKRALYNDMLGNPNQSTPMSATEVAERQADLSRRMGSAFGRLQAELVDPVIKRVIWILKQLGRIELPTVNNREVSIRSVSPLAQAQAQQDISNTLRFMEAVGTTFGPETLNQTVKQAEATEYLANKFNVPEQIVRTPAEVQQIQAQQQAEQLELMEARGGVQQGQPQPQ